jgi:hypothetical protein
VHHSKIGRRCLLGQLRHLPVVNRTASDRIPDVHSGGTRFARLRSHEFLLTVLIEGWHIMLWEETAAPRDFRPAYDPHRLNGGEAAGAGRCPMPRSPQNPSVATQPSARA